MDYTNSNTGCVSKSKSSSKSEGTKLRSSRQTPTSPLLAQAPKLSYDKIDPVRKAYQTKAGFHHRCPREVSSMPNAGNQLTPTSPSYRVSPVREILGRKTMSLKPEGMLDTVEIQNTLNSSRLRKPGYTKITENQCNGAHHHHYNLTKPTGSASNPTTPNTVRITNPPHGVSSAGVKRLSSKSELGITTPTKVEYKGLEYLRAAGYDLAETPDSKNQRIIQWLKTLPSASQYSNPYKQEVKPLDLTAGSGKAIAHHNTKLVHSIVSQNQSKEMRRQVKANSTEISEPYGSHQQNWLKTTSSTKPRTPGSRRDIPETNSKYLTRSTVGISGTKHKSSDSHGVEPLQHKGAAKRGK